MKSISVLFVILITMIVTTQPTFAFENWTTQTSGTAEWLYGITYADNTFVVVGDNGIALTSPDGITWASQTSGTVNPLRGITYANNTFVAVGDAGTILTSSDGVTWTPQTSGTTQFLYGITYDNNIFVVVGSSRIVVTSPDGVTWTPQATGGLSSYRGVIYGNNIFVAVGRNSIISQDPDEEFPHSGVLYTSPDGFVWTSPSAGVPNLLGIIYSSNTFIAVGEQGAIFTSSDGATWNPQTTSSANSLQAITYGNNIYVAVGSTGIIRTSLPQYTLTFNTNGGSAISSITDDYSASITTPSNPTRSGYVFAGWSPSLPSTVPSGDQTYIAQWTPTYTLDITTTNGSVTQDPNLAEYEEDTEVTLTATPNEGYEFSSWSGDCSGTNPECILTMDANKSVVANFTEESNRRSSGGGGSSKPKPTEIPTTLPTDIEALKALLAQLQAQLAALLSNTPAANNNPFTRDLYAGIEGEDVKQLQILLNSKGFIINTSPNPGAPGFESTYFGNKTQDALKKYQEANNITPVTGYFGVLTRGKIVQ